MPSKETDQLQDVQRRVQLARELFAEQGEYIRSIVRFAASNVEDSEDLIQELFLFFVAKPVPDDVLNIRGYLYKVILDKIRDWQRADVRHQIKLRHYGQEKSKKLTALTQDQQQQESIQKILDLVEKHLSKTEVKAIVLRYQNQFKIEDIAKEMKINPRSVSRYISVGLKKIRQLFNIKEGEDHDKE